jgi:hypothetical protein
MANNPKPATPTPPEPKPRPEPLQLNPTPIPPGPKVERATWALAVLTGIVAIFTAALAVLGFLTMRQERQATERELGVRTWLYVEERSDSDEMNLARTRLAQQLDPYDPNKRGEVDESILDFFESVGSLYNHNLLNEEPAASSFSWEVTRWWEAAKTYIADERRAAQDQSLLNDLEAFAKAMAKYEKHYPNETDVKQFLADQKNL